MITTTQLNSKLWKAWRAFLILIGIGILLLMMPKMMEAAAQYSQEISTEQTAE